MTSMMVPADRLWHPGPVFGSGGTQEYLLVFVACRSEVFYCRVRFCFAFAGKLLGSSATASRKQLIRRDSTANSTLPLVRGGWGVCVDVVIAWSGPGVQQRSERDTASKRRAVATGDTSTTEVPDTSGHIGADGRVKSYPLGLSAVRGLQRLQVGDGSVGRKSRWKMSNTNK
ncbi:hypothetical protein Bbelb_088490 [Branchiostoma belcheri]|nr:hypothetical protein Bbelb_088490 [Branchiostoma belcheri]